VFQCAGINAKGILLAGLAGKRVHLLTEGATGELTILLACVVVVS
jgi:hypothetical protein